MNIRETRIDEFLNVLSSKTPTPGGGGAAALTAAVACALGNMAGSISVGKQGSLKEEEKLEALNVKAHKLQKKLLKLADKDVEVFSAFMELYKHKPQTQEEKMQKQASLRKGYLNCARVPLEIMKCCGSIIELCEAYSKIASPFVISDVACGVITCKAAMQAASLNVYINMKCIDNQNTEEAYDVVATDCLNSYCNRADKVFNTIQNELFNKNLEKA